MPKKFSIIVIIFLLAAVGIVAYFFRAALMKKFYAPTDTRFEQVKTSAELENGTDEKERVEEKDIEIVADNLQIPWEIVFLPDGDLLVSERPGNIKKIRQSKEWQAGKEVQTYVIEDVERIGEGGLLGMALHPDFAENHFIYLYLTARTSKGPRNRVVRYRFEDDRFFEKTIIIDGIPASANHNGGRIAFSPDKDLYITTGDAGQSGSAQDVNSLAGKILRINDDGSIPSDNPFGNEVYSFGHRNPQGLAWDDKGQLWATEHGRSGILSGFDELNLIGKGKNYGWPIIEGDEERAGMESPVLQSGADETWAPAGAAFWNGSIFFGGLRGESLYQAKIINGNRVSLKVHFRQEFGRIRAVVAGPDNYLYFSTSNTDGRGKPRAGDDKIIRVNPKNFID